MQRLEDTSTTFSVILAIIGYSLCSSTLLLANKMSIEYLPSPSVVSLIQIVFSTLAVLLIKLFGYQVDWFEWDKVKSYSIYIVIFVLAIYTNMKALSVSNVETVIVFRACTPIAVSIIEYFFMNRELPSLRSSLSLGIVAVGALIYCLSDSQLSLSGLSSYTWVIIYLFMITLEMTYGKTLTSSVKMDSVWGPVLYCNALAVVPMFSLAYFQGDLDNSVQLLSNLPFNGIVILLFSCVVGTIIGYTGWLCRAMVSGTTFTLVGVVNKFLTVLLNVLAWDKHSTPFGIFSVCLCLGAGFFYQQAPRRDEKHKEQQKQQKQKENVDLEKIKTNGDTVLEKTPLLSEEQVDKK